MHIFRGWISGVESAFITKKDNNVMTTRYITLSPGKVNVMTTSVTTIQIFIEITNFDGNKITLKMSYYKQNLTQVIISYEIN